MRFRYSLRWLFGLVGLAAIVCAFWPTIRQTVVSRQLQAIGATIQLDDDTEPWYDRPPKSFVDHLDADVTEIVWDANLQNGNTRLIDDAAFARICGFSRVWNITLDNCAVTDRSIGEISHLPFLSVLRLRRSQVGDAGVKTIVQNGRIENLILANSLVTDASACHYKFLPKLYYLDISGTMITDASVPEIAKNHGLTYLNVRGTGVTQAGVLQLQGALPNCKISPLSNTNPSNNSLFINSTPHAQKLADEGCRLTNFHTPQAVCSASRAALLTGCSMKIIE